jgi:hypothetical protein
VTSIDGRISLPIVRGIDEASTQRLATLFQEAVRSASLDGLIPGKVVVVKQVDLSGLIPAPTPSNLPQIVETVVQRMVATAASAEDPAAATAQMVYFKDDSAVIQSLAQRVASNKPTTEWFWPSVVKGWTPNTPVDRAIPLLIERAVTSSGGIVTLAQVVETLASTGVLDKLLERLSPSDGRALLKAVGWTEAMVHDAPHNTDLESLAPQVPSRAQTLVQRWVGKWGGDVRDPRALWLGAMVLVADRPGRAATAQLPDVVKVWLASVVEQASTATTSESARAAVAMQGLPQEDLIADARVWLQSHPRSPLDSLFGGGPPAPVRRSDLQADEIAHPRVDGDEKWPDEQAVADDTPTWKKPRETTHAGFLFLVPLLTKTGVHDIVARDPTLIDRDWPEALLLRLARRLGIPHEDCAVAWITTRPVTLAHADRALTAEVFRAARIRLRMEAELTMRQLVHRPGALSASRTTIDVLVHHSELDANVERAGLNTDPGLVPWLGRALQFHYFDAVDLNA